MRSDHDQVTVSLTAHRGDPGISDPRRIVVNAILHLSVFLDIKSAVKVTRFALSAEATSKRPPNSRRYWLLRPPSRILKTFRRQIVYPDEYPDSLRRRLIQVFEAEFNGHYSDQAPGVSEIGAAYATHRREIANAYSIHAWSFQAPLFRECKTTEKDDGCLTDEDCLGITVGVLSCFVIFFFFAQLH